MDVLCDSQGTKTCPAGGVGIYNPGFWGMNIEQGKAYKLVFYVRSSKPVDITASLTDSSGSLTLATSEIAASSSNWTKKEVELEANGASESGRLQLTTNDKGTVWFDQVSLMPVDTYKGHGFRKDLIKMVEGIKPRFVRFPGGCFVEGEHLRNAFRWKASVGPWENRPGHFGDVWNYWTDEGLGYFEFLQLSEDLGAAPVWVFNNGISHQESVDPAVIGPFVQEALDGLEFAKGDAKTKWGLLRAKMGHPEPFNLSYVAIGNEDCWKPHYRDNYLKFYNPIKQAYPDIKIISNCDASSKPLDHPADYYDFHIYTSASDMFSRANQFDNAPRTGPKAFVSEYAVTGRDANTGSLLAALGEAAFLIGVEKNSDVVEMASYAPLFVNVHDRKWNPDAIAFNSSHKYGTPSYYMQQFFIESSGATLLGTELESNASSSIVASAITWKDSEGEYLRIKVVNFGSSVVSFKISIDGLDSNSVQFSGLIKTELTSSNVMDENSLDQPFKIAPATTSLTHTGQEVDALVSPHSITSYDFIKDSSALRTVSGDSSSRSSI
uniref:non-reducing end alpha-L-arabinofuranosidase n=1 Tax=Kalanchoe fedtschenkoi TaxID=63787 RepID=A0A7N0UZ65_KALFE